MKITGLKLPAVRRAVQDTLWAIQPEKLEQMLAILELHAEGRGLSQEQIQANVGARARTSTVRAQGAIAVMPLYGVVAQRMNMFMQFSGGTSTDLFGRDFDALVNNPDIGAIVLDVDSPGGAVAGTPELAKKIYDARGAKPIIAVCNSLMCSAAYWIGSAADECVSTASADGVGSIGVVAVHQDVSKMAEMAGVKFTIIRAPEHKAETNPYEPLSPEARDFMQEQIDETYGMFTAAVGKHRDISAKAVREDYGRGRVLTAKQALAAGMIDRIATLDEVIAKLGGGKNAASRARTGAATMRGNQPVSGLVLASNGAAEEQEEEEEEAKCSQCGAALEQSGDAKRCRKCEPSYFEEEEEEEEGDDARAAAQTLVRSIAAESGGVREVFPVRGVSPIVAAMASLIPSAREAAVESGPSASQPSPAPQGQETPVSNPTAAPPGAGPADGNAILVAERARVARINALCAQESMPEIAAELIASGSTEDQASSRLLAVHRERRGTAAHIAVGADRAADRQFGTFGEQLVAVIQAGRTGGRTDPRLTRVNHQALQVGAGPTGMNEGVGSEGGFFIEPQLLPGVIDPVYADDPILSRVTRVPLAQGKTGVKYHVVEESSRIDGSRWGGIKMAWLAEGDELDKAKVKTRKMVLELKKLGSAAYITEELMEDAPAAEALLTRAFQAELRFMLAIAIFRGTGAGQPLGFETSDAKVDVAIEGTQNIANSADFLAINTAKMLARIPAALWGEVIWLYNQQLLPHLLVAKLGGTTVPAFTPAAGAANRPNDAIWGRAAFASEIAQPVGTPGDLLAVVPSQYHMIDRGPKSATSMHVRFLFDEMILKITYRVDGSPIWKEAVTPYKGADKQAPFVRLAVRV